MTRRTQGVVAIVLGVLLNNYAYLHDLFMMTHGGFIFMGIKSMSVALLGIALIALGTQRLAGARG